MILVGDTLHLMACVLGVRVGVSFGAFVIAWIEVLSYVYVLDIVTVMVLIIIISIILTVVLMENKMIKLCTDLTFGSRVLLGLDFLCYVGSYINDVSSSACSHEVNSRLDTKIEELRSCKSSLITINEPLSSESRGSSDKDGVSESKCRGVHEGSDSRR